MSPAFIGASSLAACLLPPACSPWHAWWVKLGSCGLTKPSSPTRTGSACSSPSPTSSRWTCTRTPYAPGGPRPLALSPMRPHPRVRAFSRNSCWYALRIQLVQSTVIRAPPVFFYPTRKTRPTRFDLLRMMSFCPVNFSEHQQQRQIVPPTCVCFTPVLAMWRPFENLINYKYSLDYLPSAASTLFVGDASTQVTV